MTQAQYKALTSGEKPSHFKGEEALAGVGCTTRPGERIDQRDIGEIVAVIARRVENAAEDCARHEGWAELLARVFSL